MRKTLQLQRARCANAHLAASKSEPEGKSVTNVVLHAAKISAHNNTTMPNQHTFRMISSVCECAEAYCRTQRANGGGGMDVGKRREGECERRRHQKCTPFTRTIVGLIEPERLIKVRWARGTESRNGCRVRPSAQAGRQTGFSLRRSLLPGGQKGFWIRKKTPHTGFSLENTSHKK